MAHFLSEEIKNIINESQPYGDKFNKNDLKKSMNNENNNQKRISKFKLFQNAVDLFYGIEYKKAENLFKYFDNLGVFYSSCEAYRTTKSKQDFFRFVNSKTRWGEIDYSTVEEFFENIEYLVKNR